MLLHYYQTAHRLKIYTNIILAFSVEECNRNIPVSLSRLLFTPESALNHVLVNQE